MSAFVCQVVTAALRPFVSLVTTLLYFDLRIRQEALDLEVMVERLDRSVASAALERP